MEAAVYSLGASIVLAIVGYIANAKLETNRKRDALITQAYADFVKGVTGVAAYATGSPEQKTMIALLADAKARVLLYGHSQVIKNMAEFWKLGASFASPEQKAAFVNLIKAMPHTDKKPVISDEDVTAILMGSSG